jgi:hypothetical protein
MKLGTCNNDGSVLLQGNGEKQPPEIRTRRMMYKSKAKKKNKRRKGKKGNFTMLM